MKQRRGLDRCAYPWALTMSDPGGSHVALLDIEDEDSVTCHEHDAATLRPLIAALQEALAELEGGRS